MPSLLNLLSLVLAFGYQPAGHFSDPGPCDSAARIGGTFAAGCRLGVWSGPASDLGLLIPCMAREDQGNRVRVLDHRRFIASTPCGLFVLDASGTVERLPLFPRPGALDADGQGRALVAARGELWRLDAWLQARPVAGLEEDPSELHLSGEVVLLRGGRNRLLFLQTGARMEMPGWGKLSVFGSGRQILVHSSGRYWIGAAGSRLDRARSLPLFDAERVTGVMGHGDRALVLTSRRLLWIGDQAVRPGRRPPVAGRLAPVRAADPDGPPWMVVNGILFKPVTGEPERAGRRVGRLLAATIGQQELEVPASPGWWAGLLPRLELVAFGGCRQTLSFTAGNDFRFGEAEQLGFMLGLSWSWELDGVSVEPLRMDIRRERQKLEELLSTLLDAYRQQCLRGDRPGIAETRALLRVLTGLDVACGLE